MVFGRNVRAPSKFPLARLYAWWYIYIEMHVEAFHVLADPTRLQILEGLRGGEQSVNEIVHSVSIDQSGVSRHLGILHEAGFVRVRPQGQRRFYSLSPEPFNDLAAWVSQYQRLWEGRLDKFGEALARRREAKKLGLKAAESSGREHLERKSK